VCSPWSPNVPTVTAHRAAGHFVQQEHNFARQRVFMHKTRTHARRRALSRCYAARGAAEFAHPRQKVWPRGGEEEKKPGGERSL